jgi:hypothetical protein
MRAFLGGTLLGLLAVVSGPVAIALPAQRAQAIIDAIGDVDCFGHGIPPVLLNPESPCGSLPGPPIGGIDDPLDTDLTVSCPDPSVLTFTHTYTLPEGATISGALYLMNVGGLEKANFNSALLVDTIPVPLPETGALGTALIVLPLIPPYTSMLDDGRLVVSLIRWSKYGGCDDVFVDFSKLIILYSAP